MEISRPRPEVSPAAPRRPTRPRARDYSGPLGILAAGAIGLSLLCGVSAMAMGDLNRLVSATLIPLNLVDLAVSNLETAAALTEQSVTEFVPTATLSAVPSDTESPSLTPQPSNTARGFVTITPTLPRRTREPWTATSVPPPTRTRTPIPPTPIPPTLTRTNTPIPAPTDTDTPVPPTFTDEPPTATEEPPTATEDPPTATEDPATPILPASNPTDTPNP